MKTSFPLLVVGLELRLLSTPSIGRETGVVGRWWSRRLPRTQRVFGCDFQPTRQGRSGGIEFTCGCSAVPRR